MSRIDEALRKSRQEPQEPVSDAADAPADASTAFGDDGQQAAAETAADPMMAFVDDPQQAGAEPVPRLTEGTGSTPQLLEYEAWPPAGHAATGKLVIEQNVGPHTVEQFRRLGAVLQDVRANGLKVLMIASAQVGDGKTLTAANLALTLGGSYRQRVLLIDADLRRPSLVSLFGLPHLPGLSEALRAEAEARISVIDLSEHVVLLPGGSPDPDPMASLNSERMRRIIDDARNDFDWIIIDTPPIAVLPDAHLLARLADASLLVIGAGKTQYGDVMKVIETLGRDRIVGVVLNRVQKDAGPESPYYYAYGRSDIRPPRLPGTDSPA